jgi:hypothetical protein
MPCRSEVGLWVYSGPRTARGCATPTDILVITKKYDDNILIRSHMSIFNEYMLIEGHL